MSNPEQDNSNELEKEFQEFQQVEDARNFSRSEKVIEPIQNKDDLIEEDNNLFSKFQGKTKSIAKFLILLSALAFVTKPEIRPKGPVSEKPKITIPEKKPDWSHESDYQELKKLVETNYVNAIKYYWKYHEKPWAKEIISYVAKENPDYILEHLDSIIDESWSEEIIKNAFEKTDNTEMISRKAYTLCMKEWGKELYIKAMKEDPTLMRFFDGKLLNQLRASKDTEFQALLDITQKELKYGKKIHLFLLAKDIGEKKLDSEKAERIASDNVTFFNYFAVNPENLDREASQDEIKNISLNIIRVINSLHNADNSKRFALLRNFSSQGLYTLMVCGSEELYTSSYNGAFDILLDKMKKENNISGDDLLRETGFKGFRTFVEIASRYNRLGEFLATMSKEEQNKTMQKIINGIGEEKDAPREASVVADIFSTIKNPEMVSFFHENTKNNYLKAEKDKNNELKVLYGLLASILEHKAKSNDDWFNKIGRQYNIPSNDNITHNELFGLKDVNIQEYFFYNDEDGKISYHDFINTYQRDKNWMIKDKGEYIVINSEKNGKRIEIYANKPEKCETAHDSIEKELNGKQLSPEIIVHRGHSYYVERTLPNVTDKTKLVFLGSCGGYKEISNIMEINSNSQIIATKGKGTGLINEPLLKMLNDEILLGQDIIWNDFWQKASAKFKDNRDFQNYISPDKNQSFLFLRGYNEYAKKQL